MAPLLAPLLQLTLKGLRSWRTGDWRMICRATHVRLEILVVAVGHRREVYDRLCATLRRSQLGGTCVLVLVEPIGSLVGPAARRGCSREGRRGRGPAYESLDERLATDPGERREDSE